MRINTTQTNALTHSRRHIAGGQADRRGSAIVLVLVSIVLMAILAATLLQVTRFERIPRPVSNIDIVVESVIEEIANQLTDDLLDNDGNMFNVRATAGNDNGGGDEPWDYPWTTPSTAFGREVESIYTGNTTAVYGGGMDDAWLASSAPDFRTSVPANTVGSNGGVNGTYGVWRHLTNLSGGYVGGNAGIADLSTVEEPNEYPINNANIPLNRNWNQAIQNNQMLVDADGDGIGDSRWEWAPLRQIGTTRYVMAVRVIDLSGRVDVNVAMGRAVGGGVNATPRGDGPTEIEGNIFMTETASASGMNPNTVQNEWLAVLNYRLSGTSPNPPNLIGNAPTLYDRDQVNPAFPSRRHYWEKGASRVSSTFVRNGETGGGFDYSKDATFKLNDAFELLQRNGLNSTTRTTLEDLMPTAMRDSTAEGTYVNNNTVTPYNWNQRRFWESDIRKQVSPFTGAMAVVRPVKYDEKRELKLDVNEAVKSATGRNKIRERIVKMFTKNFASAGQLHNRYPHLRPPFELADQLTVNLADYIDQDNRVTTMNNFAGFEALPYITEVYTQRLYEVTGANPDANNPAIDNIDWTASPDQGYVIEIGNPFAKFDNGTWSGRPVSLKGVWIRMSDGGTARELSGIAGVPDELKPGEVLHLYRDSSGNTNDATMDELEDYHTTTASGTFTQVHTAQGPAFPAQRSPRISLHAELQDSAGTAASWAYSACEVRVSGATETDTAPTGTFAAGDQGYVITGYQGIGQGLRMMTVAAVPRSGGNARGFGDDTASLNSPSVNSDSAGAPGMRAATRSSYTPNLADEDKDNAPNIFGKLDNPDQQIVWHDSPRGRMQWIGDMLQIPLIGPSHRGTGNDSLMADAFFRAANNTNNLTNGIQDLMLPYKKQQDSTIPVIDSNALPIAGQTFGVYNYPHALLLMEQFTTFSPAYDGEDGNDDGKAELIVSPNEDEALVPGKINLNTASFQTLVRALPYPDLETREAIATAIIQRREDLRQRSNHGVGADNVPAIAYTNALYEHIERLGPGFVPGFPGNPSRDGTDTTSLNGSRIDFNDFEDSPGDFGGLKDGVIDDREEELMLAKWLSEVGETRSDVFAAYIVVQGYPAANFKAGAIESARLIVIFSRAGVQDEDERAVEIGRFRFK